MMSNISKADLESKTKQAVSGIPVGSLNASVDTITSKIVNNLTSETTIRNI